MLSIFHDLEIIAIFLQTLASSLSWTMQSFSLTAVLWRCFLIQLSCSFFAASAKHCNSNINLQSHFYNLILILLPSFSQSVICCDASCGNTSPVTKFLMWWYCLFSNPSWCDFSDDDSPDREREPEPSNFGHLHQNYYLTGQNTKKVKNFPKLWRVSLCLLFTGL